MIEVNMTYDLLPGTDMKAYMEWVKKTIDTTVKQPGLMEFRANRNVLGTPLIRATSVWRSLEDWARYNDSPVWRTAEGELRGFAGNFKVELWGPSPLLPEAIRPSR